MRPVIFLSLAALGLAAPADAQNLSSADRAAAFRAAGFKRLAGQWQACGDPGTATYIPGKIEQVRDLNGDGRPEAIITEGSIFCFGGDEVGFTLVSKQADARWTPMLATSGVAIVLATRGAAGWPDIQVGGQGFCFPVQRWNGRQYNIVRFQYEGKACKPDR